MVTGDSRGGGPDRGDRLAPVIPLFGAGERADAAEASASQARGDDWHRSWIVDHAETDSAEGDAVSPESNRAEVRRQAETALLKKLRGRSLSEREARGALAQHELDPQEIDAIVAAFLGHGYLDDIRLAEQLVHVATDRKAQGRHSVAQTLAARGLGREVIDAVLAELPDDDAERALAFARQKARNLVSLDRDTALRRLHGQLARRGFAGSLAMSAARQALDEAAGPSSGVRFR
ncbi:regulatory protein RecX [Microbacterium sp. LjRoot45]|uniref:regulatory protein RecX n=1 Tax=Microbacterium sp. LjRoot45 TaxID=3342329 RepID=UPI003ECC2207